MGEEAANFVHDRGTDHSPTPQLTGVRLKERLPASLPQGAPRPRTRRCHSNLPPTPEQVSDPAARTPTHRKRTHTQHPGGLEAGGLGSGGRSLYGEPDPQWVWPLKMGSVLKAFYNRHLLSLSAAIQEAWPSLDSGPRRDLSTELTPGLSHWFPSDTKPEPTFSQAVLPFTI